ncbi:response regulator [Cohnella sp.]|uniref:response regulator transcription factor n=1 Tax=Cohnella sp. TaxID=1883426 RepID=UPI00356B47DD
MWRTLIVDDEQHARASLTKLMVKSKLPFEIVGTANDGQGGLEAIRKLQPDVVITDIDMPVMDGVKLLKSARDEGYDCRFIMLTCMNEFEYARQSLEFGASGYLLKLSMDVDGLKQAMGKVSRELEQQEQLRKAERWFPKKDEGEPTDHPEMNKIIRHIEEHYAEEITLKRAAELISMDASYVSDLFKKKTSQTLTHYVQNRRIQAAKMLLTETNQPVGEIARQVGFENDNYFIKIFKRWCGVTPSEFRKEENK